MRGLSIAVLLLPLSLGPGAGCATNPYQPGAAATIELKARALESLKQGVRYPHVPVVRCQAVEALRRGASEDGLPWIRSALLDEAPGVRFAACVALGELRDAASKDKFGELLADPNRSVQMAAVFGLHRLGDTHHSSRLAEALLYDRDSVVRRNAALLLGLLAEPGAVKLLARVMEDADEALRLQALESMARLGSAQACQQLLFHAHSGLGARETFAINALAETRDPQFANLYRERLSNARHPETRLAAARALGMLGNAEGLDEARDLLDFDRPDRSPDVAKDDSPEVQIIRARQLAALALGAIGSADALPGLAQAIQEPYDPRVELAAALAVLEILRSEADDLWDSRSG
jgi:HEAT repeat protein